jgi:hypothetical protein
MTDATPALVAIATTALLLGGGIAMAAPFGDQAEDELSPSSQASTATETEEDEEGQMTVEDSEETHEGVEPTAPPFFASRVITIEGRLTLAELLVDLSNVNGDVEIDAEAGTDYRLEANLTGYGATPEDARQNRDEMRLAWDAGSPGDRQLVAQVDHGEGEAGLVTRDGDRKEADLTLIVPASVEVNLAAASTNGDVQAEDLRASTLVLGSTNGEVDVESVRAPEVQIDTTNGAIDAELEGTREVALGSTTGDITAAVTPAEEGSIDVDNTNGDVDLAVPETGDHGYLAEAATTNGDASIALEDGDTESSDGGDRVAFRTDGFDQRPVQVTVTASSTNGAAHVGPQ